MESPHSGSTTPVSSAVGSVVGLGSVGSGSVVEEAGPLSDPASDSASVAPPSSVSAWVPAPASELLPQAGRNKARHTALERRSSMSAGYQPHRPHCGGTQNTPLEVPSSFSICVHVTLPSLVQSSPSESPAWEHSGKQKHSPSPNTM